MKRKKKNTIKKISKGRAALAYSSLGAMLVGAMAPIINQVVKREDSEVTIFKFNERYFKTREAAQEAQKRFLSLSSLFSKFTKGGISREDMNNPEFRQAKAILEEFISKMFAVRYFAMDKVTSLKEHFTYTAQNVEDRKKMLEEEKEGKLKYGELEDITDLIRFASSTSLTSNIFNETDRVMMSIFGDGSNQVFSKDEMQYINEIIQAGHYKKNVEAQWDNSKTLEAAGEGIEGGDLSGNTYSEDILKDFNKFYNLLKKLDDIKAQISEFKDDQGSIKIEEIEKLINDGAMMGWNNETIYSSEEVQLRNIISDIELTKKNLDDLKNNKGETDRNSKPGTNHSGTGDESNHVYEDWELKLSELQKRRKFLEDKGVNPAPEGAIVGLNKIGTGDKTGRNYSQKLLDIRKEYFEKKDQIKTIIERINLLRAKGTSPAIDEVWDKDELIGGGTNPNDPTHAHKEQVGLGDGIDHTYEMELAEQYDLLQMAILEAKAQYAKYVEELKNMSTKLNPGGTDLNEKSIYEVIQNMLVDDSQLGWNWKRNYSEKEVMLRNLTSMLSDAKKSLDELINNGVDTAPDDAEEGSNDVGVGVADGKTYTEEQIQLRNMITQNEDLKKYFKDIEGKFGNSLKHPPADAKYSKDGKHYEPKGLADDEHYSLRFANAVKLYNLYAASLKEQLENKSKLLEKYKNSDNFSDPAVSKGTEEWADKFLTAMVKNNAIPGLNSKRQYSNEEIAYRELNKEIARLQAEENLMQENIKDLSLKATHPDEIKALYEEYKKTKDESKKPILGLNNAGTGDKSGANYDDNVKRLQELYEKYVPVFESFVNSKNGKQGIWGWSEKNGSPIYRNRGLTEFDWGNPSGQSYGHILNAKSGSGFNNPNGGGDENQTVFTTDKRDNTIKEYQAHMLSTINNLSEREAGEAFTELISAIKNSTEIKWGKQGNEFGFYYEPDDKSLDQGDKSGRTYLDLFSDDEVSEIKKGKNDLINVIKKLNFNLMNTPYDSDEDLVNSKVRNDQKNWDQPSASYINSHWSQYTSDNIRNDSYAAYKHIFDEQLVFEQNFEALRGWGWNKTKSTFSNYILDPSTGKPFESLKDFKAYMSKLSYSEKVKVYQDASPALRQNLENFKQKRIDAAQGVANLEAEQTSLQNQLKTLEQNFSEGNPIFKALVDKWSEYDSTYRSIDLEIILRSYKLDYFEMNFNGKVASYDQVKNKIKEYTEHQNQINLLKEQLKDATDATNESTTSLNKLKKEDPTGEYFKYINTHVESEFPIVGLNSKGIGAEDNKVHTYDQQRMSQLYNELFEIVKKVKLAEDPTKASMPMVLDVEVEERVVEILNNVMSNTRTKNYKGQGDKTGNDYSKHMDSQHFASYQNAWTSAWGTRMFRKIAEFNNLDGKGVETYKSYKDILRDYVICANTTRSHKTEKTYLDAKHRLEKIKFPTNLGSDYSKMYNGILKYGPWGYQSNKWESDKMIDYIIDLWHSFRYDVNGNKLPYGTYDFTILDINDTSRYNLPNNPMLGDGSQKKYDQSVIDAYTSTIKPLQDLLNKNKDYFTFKNIVNPDNTVSTLRIYNDDIKSKIMAGWPPNAEINDDLSPLLNSKGAGDQSGNEYAADDPKIKFFEKYKNLKANIKSSEVSKKDIQAKLDSLNNWKIDMEITGYHHEFKNNEHKYIPIPLIKFANEIESKRKEWTDKVEELKDFKIANKRYLENTGENDYYNEVKFMEWALKYVSPEYRAKAEKRINDLFLEMFKEEDGYTKDKVQEILNKLKSVLQKNVDVLIEDSKDNPLTRQDKMPLTTLLNRLNKIPNLDTTDFWYNPKFVYEKLDLLSNIKRTYDWLRKRGAHMDGTPNKRNYSDSYKAIRAALLKYYKKSDGTSYTETTLPFNDAVDTFMKMMNLTMAMANKENAEFDKLTDDSHIVNGVEMGKFSNMSVNVYNPYAEKGHKFSFQRDDWENNGYTKLPDYFAASKYLNRDNWEEKQFSASDVFAVIDLNNTDQMDFVTNLMTERITAKTGRSNLFKGDGSGNTYTNWMFDIDLQEYKELQEFHKLLNVVYKARNAEAEKDPSMPSLKSKFKELFAKSDPFEGGELEAMKKVGLIKPDDAVWGLNEKQTGDQSGNTYTQEDIDLFNELKKVDAKEQEVNEKIKSRLKYIDAGIDPAPLGALKSSTGKRIEGRGDMSGRTYSKEEYEDAKNYYKFKTKYLETLKKIEDQKNEYESKLSEKQDGATTDELWTQVIDPHYKEVESGWNNPLLFSEIEKDYRGKSDQMSVVVSKIADSKARGITIAPEGAAVGKNTKPKGTADGKVWSVLNLQKRDTIQMMKIDIASLEFRINKLVAEGIEAAPEDAVAHDPNDPIIQNALHPEDTGDATNRYYEQAIFDAKEKLANLKNEIVKAEAAFEIFMESNSEAAVNKALDLRTQGAEKGLNNPTYWSDEEIELRDIKVELENLNIEIEAIKSNALFFEFIEIIDGEEKDRLTPESIEGENEAPTGIADGVKYSDEQITLRDLLKEVISLENDHGMTESPVYIEGTQTVDDRYKVEVQTKMIVPGLDEDIVESSMSVSPYEYYLNIDDKAIVGKNYKPYGDFTNNTYTQEEIDSMDDFTKQQEHLQELENIKATLEAKGVVPAPETGYELTNEIAQERFAEYWKKVGPALGSYDQKNKEFTDLIGKHIDKKGDGSGNVYSLEKMSNVGKYVQLNLEEEKTSEQILDILSKYNEEERGWMTNGYTNEKPKVMIPEGDDERTDKKKPSILGMNPTQSSYEYRDKFAKIQKIGVGRTAIDLPTKDHKPKLGFNSDTASQTSDKKQYSVLFKVNSADDKSNHSSDYIKEHMVGSDKVRRGWVLKKTPTMSNLSEDSMVFTNLQTMLEFIDKHRELFPPKLLNAFRVLDSDSLINTQEEIYEEKVSKDFYSRIKDNYNWGDN